MAGSSTEFTESISEDIRNAYQLNAQDDDWEEKIIARAEQIKKNEFK